MNSADFFDQKAIRKEQTQDEQHRRIDEKLRASKSHWWSRRDYSQLTAEERDLIKNRDQYSSRRDAWHFGVIQAGNARYTVKEDRQKTRTERQETKRRIETKKLNQAIDNMPDAEKERYLEYWSTRDPEAMKEYQAFMAKKNKNSGNAAAAANENATNRANGGAAVAVAETDNEDARDTAKKENTDAELDMLEANGERRKAENQEELINTFNVDDIDLESINYTCGVSKHIDEIITNPSSPYRGKKARPFIDSHGTTLLIREIMSSPKPVTDDYLVTALKLEVQGEFRGKSGNWELIYDVEGHRIVHFNFVGIKGENRDEGKR